ncbi:ribosome-binding factor A [Candidatus Sneabacter namystus]|uniref:Ribosome-binding factor A n=1 Tax=Candidatus Sneabacter namystus TaxID=2601646 RepID=A0A5C0UJ77_9RICK|nr:ribosome-binding factor A [Candidatus Sneabacter namystus]QEK39810.1 ribosome-binding factor A [Candidatus Sneabacter namystus]
MKKQYREKQVAKNAQYFLSKLLSGLETFDSSMRGVFLSVTDVRVSSDLRLCSCFYTLRIDVTNVLPAQVSTVLEENKKRMRFLLSRYLNLKYAPDLRFTYAAAFDNVSQVQKLLQVIRKS